MTPASRLWPWSVASARVEVPVPTQGGIRVLLVATDPDATKQTVPDGPPAVGPLREGQLHSAIKPASYSNWVTRRSTFSVFCKS